MVKRINLRLEDYPDYVREKARFDKVAAKLSEKESELQELRTLYFNLNNGSKQRELADEDSEKILSVIDQDEWGDLSTMSLTSLAQVSDRQRAVKLEIVSLEAALGKQKKKLGQEKAKAIREIVSKIKPEYDKLIKEQADHLVAVSELITQEKEMLFDLEQIDSNVPSSIFPVTATRIGEKNDQFSWLSSWLKEAFEFGHLNKKYLPAVYKNIKPIV